MSGRPPSASEAKKLEMVTDMNRLGKQEGRVRDAKRLPMQSELEGAPAAGAKWTGKRLRICTHASCTKARIYLAVFKQNPRGLSASFIQLPALLTPFSHKPKAQPKDSGEWGQPKSSKSSSWWPRTVRITKTRSHRTKGLRVSYDL